MHTEQAPSDHTNLTPPSSAAPPASWWRLLVTWTDSAAGVQTAPCQTLAGAWEMVRLSEDMLDGGDWRGATIRLTEGHPSAFPEVLIAHVDPLGDFFAADWTRLGPADPVWQQTAPEWAKQLHPSLRGGAGKPGWRQRLEADLFGLAKHAEQLFYREERQDLARKLGDVLLRVAELERVQAPTRVFTLANGRGQDTGPALPLRVSAQVIGGHTILLRGEGGRELCSVATGEELALLLDYHLHVPEEESPGCPGWRPWSLTNANSFDLPRINTANDLDRLSRQATGYSDFAGLVAEGITPSPTWPKSLTTCLFAERTALVVARVQGGEPLATAYVGGFADYTVLIATDPQYWTNTEGEAPTEEQAYCLAGELGATVQAEFPGVNCEFVDGSVEKHDQSTGPSVSVRERLETWTNSRMGEMLTAGRTAMPEPLLTWRVDEAIECLSYGGELREVEAALLAAMPNAYGQGEHDADRETPPEPDANPERKLAAIWGKLAPEIQAAITRAADRAFGAAEPPTTKTGRGR